MPYDFSEEAEMTNEPDYIPFGPEWEKEMMKLPKKILIEMLREKLIDKQLANNGIIAKSIHYPDCWDTAAYPSLVIALWELIGQKKGFCPVCGKEQFVLSEQKRQ